MDNNKSNRLRLRVRMFGSLSAFRVINIEGASEAQIRLAITIIFSLASQSYHLIEVRDAGPPVVYGVEIDVLGGLNGAHEIIVEGKILKHKEFSCCYFTTTFLRPA